MAPEDELEPGPDKETVVAHEMIEETEEWLRLAAEIDLPDPRPGT